MNNIVSKVSSSSSRSTLSEPSVDIFTLEKISSNVDALRSTTEDLISLTYRSARDNSLSLSSLQNELKLTSSLTQNQPSLDLTTLLPNTLKDISASLRRINDLCDASDKFSTTHSGTTFIDSLNKALPLSDELSAANPPPNNGAPECSPASPLDDSTTIATPAPIKPSDPATSDAINQPNQSSSSSDYTWGCNWILNQSSPPRTNNTISTFHVTGLPPRATMNDFSVSPFLCPFPSSSIKVLNRPLRGIPANCVLCVTQGTNCGKST